MKKTFKRVLSLAVVFCMILGLTCMNVYANGGTKADTTAAETADDDASTSYEYSIVHLDNGRKYYSVDSIKTIIDNAAAAGFNYIELAVGNDGMRFLLDDMSLSFTADDTEYSYTGEEVSSAIHTGNEAYYNETTDELTESEMNEIIAYAAEKGVGIIPCVNTPGHMDAILDAGEALTAQTLSYSGSGRTIDVTNETAVAFTQALLQKYIDYFAGKGCTVFNMGADEYANDVYTTGSMGFGVLQSAGQYSYYVEYVNEVAALIEGAGMTPMAFNDGIYFNNNTSSGTFDTDIMIAYWSSGWSGYTVASASALSEMGFKMINTHGDYYWIVGGNQCSASTASNFSYTTFQGSTISDPTGAMFCIWSDSPGALTDEQVASQTADVIAAFGATLPTAVSDDTEDSDEVTLIDEDTNVAVTASGLTEIDVTSVTNPSIEGASAYDITLTTGSGTYTDPAEVTIPIPEGWDTDLVYGYVAKSDAGEAVTGITGTVSEADGTSYFTFIAPHFSEVGIYTISDDGDDALEETEVTEAVTITVSVGGTYTVTIADSDYSGITSTDNDSVATVSSEYGTTEGGTILGSQVDLSSDGTYTGVITDGSGNYLVNSNGTLSTTTDITAASTWTVVRSTTSNNWGSTTTYTISNNGYYLTVSSSGGSFSQTYSLGTSSSSSSWSYDSTNGFYQRNISTSRYLVYSGGWTVSTSTSGAGFLYSTTTSEAWTGTTLTFTGVSAGTTTVTVGNTLYTIVVTDAPPTDANTDSSVTVEYWITNAQVTANNATSMTISSSAANSTTGVILADTVPSTGTSTYGNMVYWMTVVLDEDNHQTGDTGDDETGDGTTIVALRYYGGAWQYQTADGTWSYLLSTDQIVSYYLQKTDVTQEITTLTKDWGYTPGSSSYASNGSTGQVALTVAVVYPDGTVSPAESDMYSTSTTIFNYWSSRDIGIIAPQNNSDYSISKITYTYGTRSGTSESWSGSETLVWNTVTTDAGSTWYDETTVWDTSYGTEPMVNGSTSGIYYTAKNTAVLILIYLDPVEKETNLTVNWVDDSNNAALINTMQVVVSYDNDEDPITFLNGLMQDSVVTTGTFTLDDDAYVTNSSGVDQTFNKDITTIPGVASQYASGLYYYVSADISDDGMTLTLHYNIDTALLSPEYVVDYGLGVEVPLSDLVDNPNYVDNVTISSGSATYDSGNDVIKYTPASVLSGVDPVTVRIYYGDTYVVKSIGFVPATTVYYEEGYAAYGTTWNVTGSGSWVDKDNKGIATQQSHIANDTSTDADYDNYGYDDAYSDDITGSEGTAAYTNTEADSLSFTFTGTGVDIFANRTSDTGTVTVRVTDGSGNVKKMLMVDTVDDGNYAVADDKTAYNSPIVSVSGLDHGTYTVTIYVCDTDGFYFDGFRVYGTIDESSDSSTSAVYQNDLEDNPSYYELRNNVLAGLSVDTTNSTYKDELTNTLAQVYASSETGNGAIVVYDSGNSVLQSDTDVQDLLDNGTKNELYLYPGMSVVFKITTNREVQIGLRSVTGVTVNYTINSGDDQTISSSVDMFYDLQAKSGSDAVETTYTITNTGSSGILSITDIKVCDSTEDNIFGSLTADEVVAALSADSTDADVDSDETVYADASLTVNLTDYTGTVLSGTDLTATGAEGESVTFAAADILTAVNSILPDGYALVDEDSVTDQTVAYGESDSVNIQIGKVAALTVTYQKYSGLFKKTTVGTVTLTKVQTASGSKATFSANEIKAAVPDGYKVLLATSSSVNYGSAASKTVTVY